MALITITTDTNVRNITNWSNFDDLWINNGATITVDSPHERCWAGINILNGVLNVVNTSSITPMKFLMGRNAGARQNVISGSSGLGIVNFTGSWIYLNNGDGSPNQTIEHPYERNYVPAVWVETNSGSNTYKPWLNITTQVGETIQFFEKDLEYVGSGSFGNFFYQSSIKEPYPWSFTGSVSSSISSSLFSGVTLLYSSSLYFGDGIKGNLIPSESRVRIPNILVTDVTPLNLISATSVNSAVFLGTVGCVFKFNTVLFGESFGSFNQPQILEIKNCAFSEYPTISECYSVVIDNVVLGSHPIIRYFPSTNAGWTTRDLRWGTQCAWSYISNAVINDLYLAHFAPNALFSNQNTATAATVANTPLYISYTNDLSVNNLTVYQYKKPKNFQYGLILNYVNDSEFNNLTLLGGDYINFINSSNNVVNNVTCSYNFSQTTAGFTSAWRFGDDPVTKQPFVLGQKYYLKTRAYRSWQDMTGSYPANNVYFYQTGSEFVDSLVYSFTPYTASKDNLGYRNHPDYFGVVPVVNIAGGTANVYAPSASVTWVRRDPIASYTVFRGTSPGFSERNGSTLVYSSSTAAGVTYVDTSSVSKPLNFDTPYYYVLRKHDEKDLWSESAEQEVVIRLQPSASNYLRQSSGFSTTDWVKSSVTVTADQKLGPNDAPIGTAAAPLADLLLFTSTAGSVTATSSMAPPGLRIGNPYVFSVYLSALTSSVSMSLSASCGSTKVSASYVVGQTWVRASLPFIAQSNTASVGIYGNGSIPINSKTYAFGAQLNTGSVVQPYINTTTAAVLQRPTSLEPSSIRVWSRGTGGSGVEVQVPAVPAGTLWYEIFISTSSVFIPNSTNCVATSIAAGAGNPLYFNNSSNNTITNLNQISIDGYGLNFLTLLNASSNNRFLNFNLNFAYAGIVLLVANTLGNNNFLHNWTVKNYRNYVATAYWITAINNAQGLTIQNLYCNNSDIPLNNLNLDVKLKNVSAANGRNSTSTQAGYTIAGSTTDQNAVAYGQVYDTIFNEFNWNDNSGSMHLNFNASSKPQLPYVITGSIFFSNTGKLYFNSTGSIEYEWPWKIYGISGFRPSHLVDAGSSSIEIVGGAWLPAVIANSRDLSIPATAGYLMAPCLKKEFAFKTGTSYGEWIELSGSLSGSNPDWTALSFDPSIGFNMKVKLTARPSLNFDGQGTTPTSSFIVGEYVTGSTSGAKAKIIDQFQIVDISTDGTIVLDDITGTFKDNERLLGAGNLNKGLANGTGSVNFIPENILLPQPTSYIDALQWFTVVNTSSLYPISTPTLTLTGMKSGSTVDVIRKSDSFILDQGDVNVDDQDYTFTYDYFQDTPVDLIIQNLGYIYQRIEADLTENDLIIPIQQTIDRNYKNLPGP